MAEPMSLQIITPDAIVFEGNSTFFVGKAIDGQFGILPNHAPMIIALDLAPLRIDQPDGTSRELAVFGGFCEIEHNKVSIVTPDCQDPSSIDVERARRAKERPRIYFASYIFNIGCQGRRFGMAFRIEIGRAHV